MGWQFIVVLIVAIPIILLPVVYAWYLNIGGIYSWVKEHRKEKAPSTPENKKTPCLSASEVVTQQARGE